MFAGSLLLPVSLQSPSLLLSSLYLFFSYCLPSSLPTPPLSIHFLSTTPLPSFFLFSLLSPPSLLLPLPLSSLYLPLYLFFPLFFSFPLPPSLLYFKSRRLPGWGGGGGAKIRKFYGGNFFHVGGLFSLREGYFLRV